MFWMKQNQNSKDLLKKIFMTTLPKKSLGKLMWIHEILPKRKLYERYWNMLWAFSMCKITFVCVITALSPKLLRLPILAGWLKALQLPLRLYSHLYLTICLPLRTQIMPTFALHKDLSLNHVSGTPQVAAEACRHSLWISAEADVASGFLIQLRGFFKSSLCLPVHLQITTVQKLKRSFAFSPPNKSINFN